jgi:hypothetical protein
MPVAEAGLRSAGDTTTAGGSCIADRAQHMREARGSADPENPEKAFSHTNQGGRVCCCVLGPPPVHMQVGGRAACTLRI